MLDRLALYNPPELWIHIRPDGDDGNPGTYDEPIATFSEAEDRIEDGRGNVIYATGIFQNQTSSWTSQKTFWALVGSFQIMAKMSGWAIDIIAPSPLQASYMPYSGVMVIGAGIYIDSTDVTGGIRIRNRAETIIGRCVVAAVVGNIVLFSLETDESEYANLCGDNKLLYCKAFGYDQAGNIGYRLYDNGDSPNELAFGFAAKMGAGGAGIQIYNTAVDAVHSIHHMNIYGCPSGRDFVQEEAGHHWAISECCSDHNPDNDGDGVGDIIPFPASGYDEAMCDINPLGNTAILNARMIVRHDVIKEIQSTGAKEATLDAHEAAQDAHRTALTGHEDAQEVHRKYMTSRAGQELAIQFKQYGELNDVHIFRGDKAIIPFALSSDGTALDLSDATVVHLTAKKTLADPEYVFDVECDIPDPGAGLCSAELTATETAEVAKLIAELEITWSDGSLSTYGQFYIYIREDIRKPAT